MEDIKVGDKVFYIKVVDAIGSLGEDSMSISEAIVKKIIYTKGKVEYVLDAPMFFCDETTARDNFCSKDRGVLEETIKTEEKIFFISKIYNAREELEMYQRWKGEAEESQRGLKTDEFVKNTEELKLGDKVFCLPRCGDKVESGKITEITKTKTDVWYTVDNDESEDISHLFKRKEDCKKDLGRVNKSLQESIDRHTKDIEYCEKLLKKAYSFL